jgi:hypothetical protein
MDRAAGEPGPNGEQAMPIVPLILNRPFERRQSARDQPQAGHAQAARFGHALALLESGRWPQAFEALSALAHDGHASAARIALMLASRGGPLFGGNFRATARDLARWRQAAE